MIRVSRVQNMKIASLRAGVSLCTFNPHWTLSGRSLVHWVILLNVCVCTWSIYMACMGYKSWLESFVKTLKLKLKYFGLGHKISKLCQLRFLTKTNFSKSIAYMETYVAILSHLHFLNFANLNHASFEKK